MSKQRMQMQQKPTLSKEDKEKAEFIYFADQMVAISNEALVRIASVLNTRYPNAKKIDAVMGILDDCKERGKNVKFAELLPPGGFWTTNDGKVKLPRRLRVTSRNGGHRLDKVIESEQQTE